MSERFTFLDDAALAGIKPQFEAAQHLPHDQKIKGWTSVGGVAVIRDLQFYMQNRDAIAEWCDENMSGWIFSGVVLAFRSETDAVLFKLRWC